MLKYLRVPQQQTKAFNFGEVLKRFSLEAQNEHVLRTCTENEHYSQNDVNFLRKTFLTRHWVLVRALTSTR